MWTSTSAASARKGAPGIYLDEFGGMKVVEVNTGRIKRLIEKRKEQGFSNASINRELAALKRAFNLADRCTPPKVAQVPL